MQIFRRCSIICALVDLLVFCLAFFGECTYSYGLDMCGASSQISAMLDIMYLVH